MKLFHHNKPFTTEGGAVFSELTIAYDTWGTLNERRDNVIWVCHALTANSDAETWWPGMVGDGLAFDISEYFIICANILGSCYGTTGPLSIDPSTGKPWLNAFPVITVRDTVRLHEALRKYLEINSIDMIIGSSIGGYQALEYSIMYPAIIKHLVFIASSARQSPWAIAFDQSQRLAIEADPSFFGDDENGGKKGLRAARSIALLSYRTSYAYNKTQAEDDDEKIDLFKASSYQDYQGDKLVKRFNAWSYYRLTQLADSHNAGRGRGGVKNALRLIKALTLCIGIKSDILYPVEEQKFVAQNVAGGQYAEIDSFFGHDGFLIETGQVSELIKNFRDEYPVK
ncbi:MAG: homoserine O-acetyltransferase [Bacteroidales bacterium]|jgi:homoserine O-acetyltransferase